MLVLILLAFGWRVSNLGGQSLWRDEIDAIYFASRDLRAALSMFIDAGQNGALYFLALRPWLRLAGTTEFALRYPSVLFGVLSVPIFWQVCQKLVKPSRLKHQAESEGTSQTPQRLSSIRTLIKASVGDVAIVAAFLLSINPYHLWYSQDAKMYSLITLLTLAAIWFWIRGIEHGGWRPWVLFLVTISIAIYTHLLMILLVPLFIIWFLIAWPLGRPQWKTFCLTIAFLTLPYLPLLWWQWDLLVAEEQLTSLTYIPLADIIKAVFRYQISSLTRPQSFVYLLPLLLLGLVGVVGGAKVYGHEIGNSLRQLAAGRRHLLVVSWLVIPVAAMYLISVRQPVFLPRYLIWIMPATMLLLSLGLNLIWRAKGHLSKSLAIVLIIYVTIFWVQVGWNEKTSIIKADLRSAVRIVQEHRQPDQLIIFQIPHLQYAYTYYTSDQDAYPFANSDDRLGWWDIGLSPSSELNDQEARTQVDAKMRRKSFGAIDIWVLLSEEELSDPRYLMIDWLNNNLILQQQFDFHEAQVLHYQRE